MNHGQSNSLDTSQPRFEKNMIVIFCILYFEIGDGDCTKITKILGVPELEFKNSRFCQIWVLQFYKLITPTYEF